MLRLERTFSAVLFDMDGTLVDSRVVVERVWRDWAAANDLDSRAILAVSHGRRTIDVVREFAKDQMDCKVEAAKIDAAEVADVDGITSIPGSADLLRRLPRSRWAVVTSASRELAIRRITAAELPIPEVLVTEEDIERGKPDPSGYILAAERLGTTARQCLIFEDAPAGIQAGLNAGSAVIAIGFANPHAFEPNCPLISDFRAIQFKLS